MPSQTHGSGMAEVARRLPRAAASPVAQRRRSLVLRLVSNQRVVAGAIVLLVTFAVALLADVLAPYEPNAQILAERLAGPSLAHPFGQDHLGRDVLSRAIYGARVSLGVGFSSVAITIVIGTIIGVSAGYFGPWTAIVPMPYGGGLISHPVSMPLLTAVV